MGYSSIPSPSIFPFRRCSIHPKFLLLVVLAFPLADSFGHGGSYRGPGSTVPPGSGGGPSTPVGPGAAAVTDWRVWWSFNRDLYLQVKGAIHEAQSLTGNDDFYLGENQRAVPRETRPELSVLAGEVLPALLRALDGTENQDLISASLMALAKVGLDASSPAVPGQRGETSVDVASVLRGYLSHSNQEIAETAALALGIQGRPESAGVLVALVRDSEAGRLLVGRKRVPHRTRSFAAYGLGQLGTASSRIDVRTLVVRVLMEILRTDESPTTDLATACLVSIGLCPLKAKGTWKPEAPAPRVATSLESQVAWLLAWFEAQSGPASVRAHAPMCIARLALAAGEGPRLAAAAMLLKVPPGSGLEREVWRASLTALGHLGDGDEDAIDHRIRQHLQAAVKSQDGQGRALARIAWARVLARPGSGKGSDAVLDKGRAWLLEDLARGNSTTRAWTALALGILGHERHARGLSVSSSLALSLRLALQGTSSPRDVGALCLALGLVGDQSSGEELLRRLEQHADDGLRSQAAVALGLLGDPGARAPLAAHLAQAKHRPFLIRELATALILLGDRSTLPGLIEGLKSAKTLADQSAYAFAIGRVGDKRAVAPLLEVLGDKTLSDVSRAFAAAALGVIANGDDLPWNAWLAADLHYGLMPSSLADGSRGVLDLL